MDRSTCSSSCVKLYLCSNPEDSVVERRALRENVFPKLREHCRLTLGLDLRVIDPFESSDPSRWPDENIRRQLIEECRESSAGPFLLALIGHQYGSASLPTQVEVSEYQLVLQESQQAGVSTQELEREYQRDENSIPPSYCLRTAHNVTCCSQLKDEEEIDVKAKEEELMKVFQTAVSQCVHKGLMTPERAQSYYRSAFDADLRFALGNRPHSDIIGRCLVYINKVINAERQGLRRSKNQTELGTATFKQETTPSDEELLSELCDNFLPSLITPFRLPVYTTATEYDRRHGFTTARRQGYAESLCQHVYSNLLELIDSVNVSEISEHSQLGDALAREQSKQEELCDILSGFYDIIRTEEEQIRAYVEQSEQQCPLVVMGGPCTGKTVLLAHCALKIKSWLPDCDPVVITHFCNFSINTSPEHLLSRLCYQIVARYKSRSSSQQNINNLEDASAKTNLSDQNSNSPTTTMNPDHKQTNKEHVSNQDFSNTPFPDLCVIRKPDICLSDLQQHFASILSLLPSTKQPLILILAGLDRLEKNFGLEIIKSLPLLLPPGVKLILSVSSNRAQVLQAFSAQRCPSLSTLEGGERESVYVCVQLGQVDRKQCSRMLASLLRSSGRRVTSGQQVLVNQALTTCYLPLYARLLHKHTSLWLSDSDVTESSLPDGVHSSISALLDHLEQKHGRPIVARAISYLTLSSTGLTEAELADLLFTDDMVQSKFSQHYSNPSSLKQIDVERLLLDLRAFLIRRTVQGSEVLCWVSRHFKLIAARKYFDTSALKRKIHSVMADYFSGKQKFETINNAIQGETAVEKQPFIFPTLSNKLGRVNLRKVLELPHHLKESNQWEDLEHGLLMSFGFHQAMVQAGLLKDLAAMLEREEESVHLCFSRVKAILANILKSGSCLLQSSPMQLPTLIKTSVLPYLEVFPVLKGYVREIRDERKKRGSGLGVVLCPAPSSVPSVQSSKQSAKTKDVSVTEAAGTVCGVVVEVMEDGMAWVWTGFGCDAVKLSLNSEQENLKFSGVKSSGQLVLLSSQCNKLFLWDVSGAQMFLQVKGNFESGQENMNKLKGFVASQNKVLMWWEKESFLSVFDIFSETLIHVQCQSLVTCLVCCSDGLHIYCGQEDGTVSIFDTSKGNLISTCSNADNSAVASIILCEEKLQMACVNKMGNVTLWELAAQSKSPRCVKEVSTGGESSNILNTDYSDKHDTLLVCHSHQVTLLETCNWELWDQFLAPQGRTFTQALLSLGSHLFLALLEDCPLILVWRVSSGQCVLSLETKQEPYTLLKTAQDVFCIVNDGSLRVWDSEMIEAAGTAPKMGLKVQEVVVEGTGEWFYTSDGSETVWKWRLKSGLPHAYFHHDGPVEKLCLSPDGVHFVTLSGGEIYIWQIETGQNILRINGSRATHILITPNSQFGVSISDRYLSRVWKLSQGSIVCSINQFLSDAQVSPESTFLIGLCRGDLLAASLWTGSISKRFSCVVSSEHIVAFSTLSEHPDFVVVMATSGAVFTWKVAEETVCMHFQLPHTFRCQPQDFHMSSNGSYALLSTENNTINLLDLSQVRLCSFRADHPVTRACLDKAGCYVAYISRPSIQEKDCVCSLHVRPVLTVVRLIDGERIGSVRFCKNPTTLAMCKQPFVFVGFEDGSVGAYYIADIKMNGEEFRFKENDQMKQCPFDREPLSWLHLAAPNVKWP
ncbi:NACHT and WD repeat domain-containing protein 2-like [Cheilinus undulatus]|uniref:NACHT and WD repeat domain-containing protein 2-like n=1 Tax=Cheilinus undulatus TaxID=241271 RepID=UPI001BD3FF95|nr:NACHT and WD repeat domain-containing protein 2-like [Cheilinus undulatus]